jgi:hypothetical protein
VTYTPIVNADQIVTASSWILNVITVEQNDGQLCLIERRNDMTIDRVFVGNQFQWREEDAPHSITDKTLAQFPGNRALINLGVVQIMNRVRRSTPEQRMTVTLCHTRHFRTYRLKDLGGAQTRYEQSEDLSVGLGAGDIRSRSASSMDQPATLEFLQCPSDGGPRDAKFLNQIRLGWDAVPGLIVTGLDPIANGLENVPMFCGRSG